MKLVEGSGRVRYAVQIEGMTRRAAARGFGIDPRTVAKMLSFSVPPGYRRLRPPGRPKLDAFVGIIDRLLEEDKGRPAEAAAYVQADFERLRDEHGYAGGLTIVKDYVLGQRQRLREVFVPLRHDHASMLTPSSRRPPRSIHPYSAGRKTTAPPARCSRHCGPRPRRHASARGVRLEDRIARL